MSTQNDVDEQKIASDEFAYKDAADRWIAGFSSRRDAMLAGINVGLHSVVTAEVSPQCPSYFARFEARHVLRQMIDGLAYGEQHGKLVSSEEARVILSPIADASLADGLEGGQSSPEWLKQLDLMNRLEQCVADWVAATNPTMPHPKFIRYGSEQVHVAGGNLGIPFL
ncbi:MULTISPECIES: hypothetical protein [Cupriavidus]|uniref:Uncharacterized protein n=2 Tax=Cupriavidus TaxID=106589 RepID=A0A3G8GUY1_9BURK|nr:MULTISPECIES: hypothetical protein [Cupriavidus]AZG12058.1 hypothetical protein EHF44_00830 [Cupriavidus pauculus]MWL91726.1 hypothetical protein [Cupriavidus sp. SW-Y-13]QBP14437.1 hypothetical protein DDF84_032490 [Cupriavidus metallidurans]